MGSFFVFVSHFVHGSVQQTGSRFYLLHSSCGVFFQKTLTSPHYVTCPARLAHRKPTPAPHIVLRIKKKTYFAISRWKINRKKGKENFVLDFAVFGQAIHYAALAFILTSHLTGLRFASPSAKSAKH